MLEYWSVGCATPRDPGFGYMVYRNDSHATFSCSLGHVFTSNLERAKTITCGVEGRWSDGDNSCVSLDFLRYFVIVVWEKAVAGFQSLQEITSCSRHDGWLLRVQRLCLREREMNKSFV